MLAAAAPLLLLGAPAVGPPPHAHHQPLSHARTIEVLEPRPAPLGSNDTAGMWHSQVGQDRTIARLFGNKRGGYFVDLAANHAILNSNTRTLERDYGWSGLCIDANPEMLWELANERVRGAGLERACRPTRCLVRR